MKTMPNREISRYSLLPNLRNGIPVAAVETGGFLNWGTLVQHALDVVPIIDRKAACENYPPGSGFRHCLEQLLGSCDRRRETSFVIAGHRGRQVDEYVNFGKEPLEVRGRTKVRTVDLHLARPWQSIQPGRWADQNSDRVAAPQQFRDDSLPKISVGTGDENFQCTTPTRSATNRFTLKI